MPLARRLLVVVVTTIGLVAPQRKSIVANLQLARQGWRENPFKMVANLLISFLVGQAAFWKFGNDQIGLFMRPLRRMGLGPSLGEHLYERLPHGRKAAWAYKVGELSTDYVRGPVEGWVYRERGFVPDVVCAGVTPPGWPTMEAIEKTVGAVLYPERVVEPESVKLSIANIYGNLFRLLVNIVLMSFVGSWIQQSVEPRIESAIRRVVRR